jgi:hypothetical protein
VVAVMRGLAPPNAIQMALAYDKDYNVPTAPGLGLYLVRGKARGGGGGEAEGSTCPTVSTGLIRWCVWPKKEGRGTGRGNAQRGVGWEGGGTAVPRIPPTSPACTEGAGLPGWRQEGRAQQPAVANRPLQTR